MPDVDLGDVTIHYETWGDPGNPRLVYVGGSGSDLRQPPTPADAGLHDRFHLLGYDHRGLGRSTDGDAAPTMADFAADLLGLLDHLGWDTCSMVGISFGGMVALEAGVTAPQRFERVALACTSPGGPDTSSFPLHTLLDLPADERRRRWVEVIDDRNADDPDRAALVLSFLEARDRDRDPTPTPGERRQLEARAGHDVRDRLPAMTMPVLIVAGRHDGIAPPANQEYLAAHLPHAELRWFDGGHGFFLEDREAMPALRGFLRGT